MLATRPRPTYVYGKRSQQSAESSNKSSDTFVAAPPAPLGPLASKMKKRENMVPGKPKSSSPRVVRVQKRQRVTSTIQTPTLPQLNPRVAELQEDSSSCISKKESIITRVMTPRPPLSPFSVNRKASPLSRPRKRNGSIAKGQPPKLQSSSPKVDVDIFILDGKGRKVSHERRVSNPNTKKKDEAKRPSSPNLETTFSESDSESEPCVKSLKPRRLVARTRPVIMSSDEEDASEDLKPTRDPPAAPEAVKSKASDAVAQPPIAVHINKKPSRQKAAVAQSGPTLHRAIKEISAVSRPPPRSVPAPSKHTSTSSTLPRTRQLTPLRRSSRALFRPPSPPDSLDSDLDLSAIDLSEVSIEIPPSIATSPSHPSFPLHLRPLLEECYQEKTGPHDFSSFIKTFSFNPIVRSRNGGHQDVRFRKIGEASYSEVFGYGDVVLKVVPLRDESLPSREVDPEQELDMPFESDAKDVLKEIIVTRAMGDVCKHFVELLKAYVVKGRYPDTLLELWDEFNSLKGSESVRPDTFSASQCYAIIVLPNGGLDLEAYTFSTPGRSGWRQACSIFWQVAKTLAHAERLVSFEHRDLHWGQVLVKNISSSTVPPLGLQNTNVHAPPKANSKYMDSSATGVQVTLIDLGLSRMDAGDGTGGEMVHWTPFDEEILMGDGDYQFDIYRYMKTYNGGDWEAFKPFTNVMWLHYVVKKLLFHKGLKPPLSPRKSQHPAGVTKTSGARSERECYECLVDIEHWLATCLSTVIPPTRKSRSRNRAPAFVPSSSPSPACAGEVVAYAEKKGWVKSF